jgi:outer membrane protein assembly factor BamB
MQAHSHPWRRPTLTALALGCGLLICTHPALADDWPQWLGPQRDGVWREDGILDKFPAGGPATRWRKSIEGGYGGPAVAGQRLYVMDRVVKGERPNKAGKGDPSFGAGPGTERVLCLDTKDGSTVWVKEYDCTYKGIYYPSGPRCTPLVDVANKRVYTLGAMGDLYCWNAETGAEVWKVNLPQEYKTKPAFWGYSASPLLTGGKLITLAGGEGSAVVALDAATGKEAWRALTTEDVGYSPPISVKFGDLETVVVWPSDALAGLDPATGKVLWSFPYPANGKPMGPSLNIPTPRLDGNRLFVSNFYHGPLVVELAKDKREAKVLWQSKSNNPGRPHGLHALMCTPVAKDGYIYGIDGGGGLVCMTLDKGDILWTSYDAVAGEKTDWGGAFLFPHGDRYFIFNEKGELLIAKMDPKEFKVLDRAKIIEPSTPARGGRLVVWCQPAFAQRSMFARNDGEIACVSLAKG